MAALAVVDLYAVEGHVRAVDFGQHERVHPGRQAFRRPGYDVRLTLTVTGHGVDADWSSCVQRRRVSDLGRCSAPRTP